MREKAPVELKTQLEQPPVGVLNKQEIGEWLWRQENPDVDLSTMPSNLTARADKLIQQWQDQGLEVYLVDGKVIFDKSIYQQYEADRSNKKQKRPPQESVYTDSMYSEAERIDLADGWSFQTGEVISTVDEIAEQRITERENQTNTVRVDPRVLGDAASTIDDFAYEPNNKQTLRLWRRQKI